MATFNVEKGSGSTPEVDGAAFAARKLIELYPRYESGEWDATELFTKWITAVIGGSNVRVTYGDTGAPVTVQGNNIIATINGTPIRLRLKADDDDFKRKKVHMITPASLPAIDHPYLVNAVNWIKAEPDLDKAQAFLLGTILLKRCR